jgi:hypothetical protein
MALKSIQPVTEMSNENVPAQAIFNLTSFFVNEVLLLCLITYYVCSLLFFILLQV